MDGKIPSSSDLLKRNQSGYANTELSSNKKCPEIPSGPVAHISSNEIKLR